MEEFEEKLLEILKKITIQRNKLNRKISTLNKAKLEKN